MNISLLGTGLLGTPMAQRILAAGHRLTVYNRTLSKTKPLKEKGALVEAKAGDAVSSGEVIVLVLSDHTAIEEVLFSGDEQSLKGRTVIQMGTISPSESISIQKKVFKQDGEYFECPVLGSKKEAAEGTLILMVGGTKERFEKWKEFLKVFGPDPKYIGELGKAAALKLAVNQLIAGHVINFSLSLGIVQKNDVDVDLFAEILRKSSLYAPMFDKKLPLWQNGDYSNPNFPLKLLLKDVKLIVEEAKEKGLNPDMTKTAAGLLQQAVDKDLGELDYSAIFEVVGKDYRSGQ